MKTLASPQAPKLEPNTFRVYLGTGRRQGTILLSEEEYQRADRRMREIGPQPEFFDQVTDQKTGKRLDLYREKCGGDCYCAVRAKPAKAVLVCLERFVNDSTGQVLFTSQDRTTVRSRAPQDEYTRFLLEGKTATYVYFLRHGRSYEILAEADDPKWKNFHPTHATKPDLARV